MLAIDKITKIDRKVTANMVWIHKEWLTNIMKFFTYIGVGGIVWEVTIGVPFLLFKRFRVAGACVLVSLLINYLLSEKVIKNLVGRKRPSTYVDDDKMLINKPKDPSFPSGHASSSFSAVAVVVLLCPWYIVLPCIVVSSIISFSRIYLQVHYLSDVICGAVFGFMVGSTIVALTMKIFFAPVVL